jgi:hypothetical protein
MWKSLGILFVILIVWLAFRSPGHPPPQFATPEERAAQAKLNKEQEDKAAADKAERAAKFAADRPNIIKKAKSLIGQHKWDELAKMDYDYAFAHDAELDDMANTARSKLTDIAMAKDRAERKKQGVHIGMTKDEVLMSSWGKPSSINTTSTRNGKHEQWVYDRYHNGYLYFDNDVLTTVSN